MPDPGRFELQDIKTEAVTADQLDAMRKLACGHEALFSRRAIKFRSMDLDRERLTGSGCRDLVLSEYTFLKRPVIVINDAICIGNAAKVVNAAMDAVAR
jgi:arsenate reductase